MRFLRLALGILVAGPVVGILTYLFTPAALFFGAAVAAISFLGYTTPLWSALAWGATAHVLTATIETLYTGYQNRKLNKRAVNEAARTPEEYGMLKGVMDLFAVHTIIEHTPFGKAFLNGFSAANSVAGKGNEPYAETANEVVNVLDGLDSPILRYKNPF